MRWEAEGVKMRDEIGSPSCARGALYQQIDPFLRVLGGSGRCLTPSIFAKSLPVVRSVNTASSPRVEARILAPFSSDTEPPVKIGWITWSTSKVVLYCCLVAISDCEQVTKSGRKPQVPSKQLLETTFLVGLAYRKARRQVILASMSLTVSGTSTTQRGTDHGYQHHETHPFSLCCQTIPLTTHEAGL